jgi:hypothetical protein
MRGSTKVFRTDSPLSFWAGTAVQESTKGEPMKHVRYRANQIPTLPTEEASGVGLMVKYEAYIAGRRFTLLCGVVTVTKL